ncbi:hypothetical protein BN12_4160006 [Nostocoides japonicum T1-X7]|uniref:Uncharacterized protein n=1 Tax=Nostocoides japonicum T1-X7 TaxID=1194083 RepID=A0A077M5A2_9MICO|nr:hypothetical protein BN12_4160006 [Tetrasphaera japonica T1-X7]
MSSNGLGVSNNSARASWVVARAELRSSNGLGDSNNSARAEGGYGGGGERGRVGPGAHG